MKKIFKKTVMIAATSFFACTVVNSYAQDVNIRNISGSDRFSTAASISQNGWKNGSENVILVNSSAVADSLSVAPLASKMNAPVLLTSSDHLDNSDTKTEISRLNAKNVIIIGGQNSISSGIEENLKAEGYNVERISGNSRVETSLNIAKKLQSLNEKTFEESFIVNGVSGLADAAGAGAIAAKKNAPIIFTDKQSYNFVNNEINNMGIAKSYLIGGHTSLSSEYDNIVANVERINGKDRQETNQKIIQRFFADYDTVYIADDGSKNSSKLIDSVLINAGIISSNNSSDSSSSLKDGPVMLINSDYGFTYEQLELLGLTSSVSNIVQVSGGNKISDSINKIADFMVNKGNENSDSAFRKIMKYKDVEIEYAFEGKTKKLTGNKILPMINVDKNNGYAVTFNVDKVKEFVSTIGVNGTVKNGSSTYAYWKNNNVVVSNESKILFDIDKETQRLIDLLNKGESAYSVKPDYSVSEMPKNAVNIGNKFVLINIKKQNMKLIENGNVVLSTSVVTGNPNKGMATPPGIFKLRSKSRNVVLRGPGYASPVKYWMPFNGSIGIHDAYWQPFFGGNRYLYAGSHGCVNTPLNSVSSLYSSISVGTPVIVVRY